MKANESGTHSVALCLVRQCVEALTIVELGLQEPSFRDRYLHDWDEGKKSHGDLRRILEQEVWPRYNGGLWDEPWTEFFGNFARAVQPYAHYTPQLMNWQFAVHSHDGAGRMLVQVGPPAYDPVKASRITLLHSLTCWTLLRLVLENSSLRENESFRRPAEDLRQSLGSSKLLFKTKDWSSEIVPHVLFKEGHTWLDE